MMRNMLNRTAEYSETVRSIRPSGNTGSFDIVTRSAFRPTMRPVPAQQKNVRTVITYKSPSRLVQYKQRQVDILTEWNVRLQQELIELRKKAAQARYLAYRDELTGLSNRHLLQDRLDQAISQARRCQKPLALLLLNLDEFTRVNDKLGRATGDKLLQMVAERLSTDIRGADTACRYGGDEFVLMLPAINNPRIVAALAAEIRVRLGEPYLIDGHEIRLTVSVGAAVYPDDGQTCEELMQQADAAMYRAKNATRRVSIVALPVAPPQEASVSQ